MDINTLGIEKISDFKDGTVFVLLGTEILGSDILKTCKDYVYVKLGDKLINHKGWLPVNYYDDINNDFNIKRAPSRDVPLLEYEIMEIYNPEDINILRFDFDEIYMVSQIKQPIWKKDIFHTDSLSVEDYFLNNFDVDIIVDEKEEKE